MTWGPSLRTGAWQASCCCCRRERTGHTHPYCSDTPFSCWCCWKRQELQLLSDCQCRNRETHSNVKREAERHQKGSCCPAGTEAISSCMGALPLWKCLPTDEAGPGITHLGWPSWPRICWQGQRHVGTDTPQEIVIMSDPLWNRAGGKAVSGKEKQNIIRKCVALRGNRL